eukprot:TRINITY_DN19382_c0_g1_i1.p1 TRINITY_DN19382_c0_g1~~TRINITY_DN19382_c0_g1_i1.p1  ORF type:complete len:245 (-),score=63.55 TRINITY_DN19382_c0_g1_i1:397-1131(-)
MSFIVFVMCILYILLMFFTSTLIYIICTYIFIIFFFLMIRRPPRSTLSSSSAASDVYKRQVSTQSTGPLHPSNMAEPVEKKQKTSHTMNINSAIDKAFEGKTFTEIAAAPISALQGLADWTDNAAEKLPAPAPKTVAELGKWKYFVRASAIVELAAKEDEGHREEGSKMNINSALDKAHEGKSLKEVCELPCSALQGIAEHSDEDLAGFHVGTIGKLGQWKFAKWAAAISTLAEMENADIGESR